MHQPDDVARAEVLGSASSQYEDFFGSAALDSSDAWDELYLLASLDPKEWTIIAVTIAGGRVGMGDLSSYASVLAVNRSVVDRFEDSEEVARKYHGRIPVVRIWLDVDQSGLRLLEHVFKRWALHAVVRSVAGKYELAIMETRDLSEQAE